MATFYEALRLKNRIWRIMLNRPEVFYIGIGFANPKKPSDGAAIILFTNNDVENAMMSSLYYSLKKITSISSVPFRVIEKGKSIQKSTASMAPTAKWRPVPGGVSIGSTTPIRITGTGGLIVIKNIAGGPRLFILSCAHVLANTQNPRAFYNTIQPGPRDGGTVADRIGNTFEYVPLVSKPGVNDMDGALAIANSNSLLDPRYLQNFNGTLVTVPGHMTSYPVGAPVQRMSRSGVSIGQVVAINGVVELAVRSGATSVTRIYRNITAIKHLQGTSMSTDSGSVWLYGAAPFFNYATAVHIGAKQLSQGLFSFSYPVDIAMRTFGTSVAIPAAGSGFKAGAVRGNPPKNNFSYVRPLTNAQIARIPVIRAKSR